MVFYDNIILCITDYFSVAPWIIANQLKCGELHISAVLRYVTT